MTRIALLATALFFVSSACSDDDPGNPVAAGSGGKSGSSGAAGETNTTGSDADDRMCELDADCGYGEIDHEIQKRSDCICLLGCPSLPLSKTTIARRKTSHDKLCDPLKDGQGQPCGVDDCTQLPAAVCDDGVCRATAQR